MAQSKTSSDEDSISSGARRILVVAEQLFAQKGFDAVSMNEIAVQAGVSKANVFHHFGRKEDLYLNTLRVACEDTAQVINEATSSAGSFEQRLADFIQHHLESTLANENTTRLILRELLEHGPQHGKTLAQQVFGDNFSSLVSLVQEGQNEGILKKDIDPALLAVVIVSANYFFFQTRDVLRHFSEVKFADDTDGFSNQVINILFNGIKND